MTHDEARVLLPSYAVGALDMAVAATVRAHLATGCRECLQEVFRRPAEQARASKPSRAAISDAVAVDALPIATPRVASPTSAPAADRNRWLQLSAVGVVVLVGLAGWATSQQRFHDARIADEIRQLNARLAELEPMRADLADRLAKTTHELAELRDRYDGERHRSATVADDLQHPHDLASADSAETPAEPVESAKPAGDIRFADGALSVHVRDVSLAEIMDEISRQSGLTVRGQLAERAVSAQFENLLLPKALRRLLRDQNFVLAYDEKRHPRILNLIGGPATGTASAPSREPQGPVAPVAMKSTTADEPQSSVKRKSKRHKMTASSLPKLIDRGVRNKDRRVRAEAWRAVIELLQADPELSSAGSNALGDFVGDVASDRADEALFYAATEAREDRLRHKAAALWQKLHDPPPAPADPQPADD